MTNLFNKLIQTVTLSFTLIFNPKIKSLLFTVLKLFSRFSFFFLDKSDIILTCFVPMMIYPNADTAKLKTLAKIKTKQQYICGLIMNLVKDLGCAFDLPKQMNQYFFLISRT
jgi:hypothetical protein